MRFGACLMFLFLATPALGGEVQCNKAGIELIKKYESFRATPYICAGGKLTVGYGTTKDVTPDMKITTEEGERLLCRDVAETEQALTRMIQTPISENQFSSLVSLAYNIGITRFSTSSALSLINSDKLDLVPDAIKKWRMAGGKVLNGLIKRRQAEVDLWNAPDGANG